MLVEDITPIKLPIQNFNLVSKVQIKTLANSILLLFLETTYEVSSTVNASRKK